MHFCDVCALGQIVSVASAIVWTKMCPQQVRLVVRRTRVDETKPYKYFMVYTTDMSLTIDGVTILSSQMGAGDSFQRHKTEFRV